MGGEGSILAMITSLKNNKALRGNKRKPFNDLKAAHKGPEKLVFEKKMTPEERLIFVKQLKRERVRMDLVKAIVMIIALGITAYLIYIMLRT